MKKILSILAVSAAVISISSCSKDDIDGVVPGPQEPVEIKIGGKSIDATTGTRSPFDNPTSGNKDYKADVYASKVAGSFAPADLVTTYTHMFFSINDAGNSTSPVGYTNPSNPNPSTPVNYPHSTDPVYLIGLYPYGGWAAPAASATKIVSKPFDGTQDLMSSRVVTTTRADGVTGGTYKTLTFHHLLTRLNLKFQADSQSAIDAWGDVKTIQVQNSNNIIEVDIENESSPANQNIPGTTLAGAQTNFDFYTNNTDNKYFLADKTLLLSSATSPGPAFDSYVMVAPKAASTEIKYTLFVTTTKHTTPKQIDVTLMKNANDKFDEDTKGRYFDITLTFTATEIKASATVNKWIQGGTGDGEIK